MEPPDWRQIGAFLRLGVPAGLAVMVEVTSFALMALFIARLGTTASASHQIASNVAAVVYMVPLALGIAASARTSYWLGANESAQARLTAWLGLGTAGVIAAAVAALLAWQAPAVAGLYVDEPMVLVATAALLPWVALYQLGDALQAVSLFLLRSYRTTVAPLLVYGVLLWGLGLSGGYWLAYRGLGPWPAMQQAQAFWITSSVALAGVATVLLWLLVRVTRRPAGPA